MSAGNMGISQLECLQLRNLVGPSGIGAINGSSIGNPNGTVVVSNIPLFQTADGLKVGAYQSNFVVPSGSGIMQVQIQCLSLGGNPMYYQIQVAPDGTASGLISSGIPSFPNALGNVTTAGFQGAYYQGLMMYNNQSSSPATVLLTVGCQDLTTACSLRYMSVNCISFGPYVQQD